MMTSITPNQIQQNAEQSESLPQSYDNMNTNDYIVSSNENVPIQMAHDDNTIQTLPDDKKEELYKKYETFDSQGNANVPYSNEYDIKQSDDEENLYDKSKENDITSNYRIKIPQVKTNATIKKFSFNNNNSNINKDISPVSKYVSTPILNTKPIDNLIDDNQKVDSSTVTALEQQISYLKSQIDLLNRELTAEKSKNSLLAQKNSELEKNQINPNDQSIIADIMSYLNVQSKEEILPKLKELINHIKSLESNSNHSSNKKITNNDKLKDELIDKLKSLYVALTGTETNDEIDIKTIWRWIKHLINTVRDLAQEKEKNYQVYQELNEANAYKDFCYEIMNEFNIDSIENFKNFINDVLGSIQQNQSEVVDNNNNANNDDKQNFY